MHTVNQHTHPPPTHTHPEVLAHASRQQGVTCSTITSTWHACTAFVLFGIMNMPQKVMAISTPTTPTVDE
jgi:hypothetical protein